MLARRSVARARLSFDSFPANASRGAFLALLALLAVACGTSGNGVISGGDAGGDATLDASVGDGDSGFTVDFGSGTHTLSSITIDPPTASIVVLNDDLTTAAKTFSAIAHFSDGTTGPFDGCTWTTDRIDLGAMVGNGLLSPTGNAGGSGSVVCTSGATIAKAAYDITLQNVDDPLKLDAATRAQILGATTADTGVTRLLYPYDGTVFPRGLQSPQVMWTGLHDNDIYALHIVEPGIDYTSFFSVGVTGSATISQAEWTKLLDSAKGTPLQVTLYRLDHGAGGTAFKSASQSWTIANATLKGIIYYWRINGGRVVRIRPGDTKPDDFLTPPAGSTLPAKSDGSAVNTGCIACHSVSRDGSTLVASYDGGWSPWASFNTTSGTQQTYSNQASGFNAVNPDGSLVVFGQSGGAALSLADAKTGASYEPSGLAAFGLGVMPAFNPDGTMLAYGVRKDGSWLDFNAADLMVAQFNPLTKQFTAPTMLVPSTGGSKIYPSFTPDSQYVAYQSSPQARTRASTSEIHLVKIDGTGDQQLKAAGNDFGTDDGASRNYEPTFNPVLLGGYYWLVFVSSRVYGNAMTVTFDSANFGADCGPGIVNCRHKQLWVTAIDTTITAGKDPSHPAFWLPGQDINDQNMRGYWSLDACKKLGDGCDAGFECCDGACKASSADGSGPKTCVKPPPGTCALSGDKCKASTDCCSGGDLECIGGVCAKRGPS